MTIMLIGLIGIAAMVPFAGRQAADSYRIVQSLATGENAIEFANSNQVLKPLLSAPWQVVDDGASTNPDSVNTFFVSTERLYSHLYAEFSPATLTPQQQYETANAVLGVGFCMDPGFWGNQTRYPNWNGQPKLSASSWGNFRRTRFPFYNESYPSSFNPFDTASMQTTPRLLRITLRDPLGADANGNNGWLRLGASRLLAIMNGGDVTPASPETDKSGGPLRSFTKTEIIGPSNGEIISSLQGGSTGATGTWLATIVPSDESPVVERSAFPTTALPFVPEDFDLSIVVFGKRDVRELIFEDLAAYNSFSTSLVPLASEKLVGVSFPTPIEAMSSSTFDVDLSTDQAVGLKSKVGDWLMLSRDKNLVEAKFGWIAKRQYHSWYRIISVSEESFSTGPFGNIIVTNQVRLSGKPWGWTISELDSFRDRKVVLPGFSTPPFPVTVGTLVPHVINVYQRSLNISSNY